MGRQVRVSSSAWQTQSQHTQDHLTQIDVQELGRSYRLGASTKGGLPSGAGQSTGANRSGTGWCVVTGVPAPFRNSRRGPLHHTQNMLGLPCDSSLEQASERAALQQLPHHMLEESGLLRSHDQPVPQKSMPASSDKVLHRPPDEAGSRVGPSSKLSQHVSLWRGQECPARRSPHRRPVPGSSRGCGRPVRTGSQTPPSHVNASLPSSITAPDPNHNDNTCPCLPFVSWILLMINRFRHLIGRARSQEPRSVDVGANTVREPCKRSQHSC